MNVWLAQTLGGYTEVEVKQIIGLGTNRLQALNDGRRKGQAANTERAAKHQEKWTTKAKDLKTNAPFLTLEKLAIAVLDWSQASGIRLKNGRAYSFRTVYDHLKALRQV